MTPAEKPPFKDGNKLCMITFLFLGNYFALLGVRHANKALRAYLQEDFALAQKEAGAARAWALWGLIPSTIVNVLIIYYTVVIMLKILAPLLKYLPHV